MPSENYTVRGSLEKLYPFLFGEFERLVSESEDWLSILEMPLDSSIDSQELEDLLKKFGESFVDEGRAELIRLLNPVQKYKRNTIPATEIQPTQVKWIVKDVIKESAIHLFAGDPNAGKSFVTMEIASKFSTGGELFGQKIPQGKVLLYGAEDSASDTVVPRLLTQGANLENIRIFNEEESLKLPQDMKKLYSEVALERPKLIVIDTVNTFIGEKTDTNSDKGIRSALVPLKKLADFYNLAIILVTHKNKGNNANALYSINGSIGYVGLARLVFLLAEDPDSEEKIFSVVKNNVGKKPNYAFDLDFSRLSEFDQPVLRFLGETDLLAHEVNFDEKTEPQSKVEECAEVILEYLEKEGRKESSVLITYCKNLDYKEKTVKRARALLKDKIEAVKEGRSWYVQLRDPVDPL